ncbi:MAG: hypothetical protein GKS05_10970 [Nitrospirales bacterium]|nr:hypothetical protein [Nitrospirales bacterium]
MSTNETFFVSVLQRPGTLTFPENLCYTQGLHKEGGQAVVEPSGHVLFYGKHGRRVLMTDPYGHPLHECEWKHDAQGSMTLAAARIYLDWGQWVGIKPEGLVNVMTLDLSKRSGWEKVTRQDLRQMASQAMSVPVSEVEFFYQDQDLVIDSTGIATIRHRKDAFYVLEDGCFKQARFMSCMGAMHWEHIDFLPVVELFQSLFPGTGSATFELIRGLYDDQNLGSPLPLQYRGMPTYPSEAAFGLFSQFFTPEVPGTAAPVDYFMDPSRSHLVTWLPHPNPPRRYVNEAADSCLMIQGRRVKKVTCGKDATGLPYVQPNAKGFIPCERLVTTDGQALYCHDRDHISELPLDPLWGISGSFEKQTMQLSSYSWREFFQGEPPKVPPAEAFSAVLLYPEDDTEIEEQSCQPFVADYFEDLYEREGLFAESLSSCTRVLIHNFDAVLGTCLMFDRPRSYTVLFFHPAYAQKQAQSLWNTLARRKQLEWGSNIQFLEGVKHQTAASQQIYTLLYRWIPFAQFDDADVVQSAMANTFRALSPGGYALMAGPDTMALQAERLGFDVVESQPVESLPSFRMHASILPQACINPRLYAYVFRKSAGW